MYQPPPGIARPGFAASALCFATASALVPLLPSLPSLTSLAAVLPACLLLGAVAWARPVVAFCLGAAYSIAYSTDVLSRRLPVADVGRDMVIVGTVVSLPEVRAESTRFRFRLEECADCWAPTVVMISWYRTRGKEPVSVHPGQTWRLPVRLRRPRGSVNPGLFDYEGWLLSEGISATGYVRRQQTATLIAPAGYGAIHHQLRETVRDWLRSALVASPVADLAVALAIGTSNDIAKQKWRVLSATGTNHLLVISGLHVGLVSVGSYMLLATLLRRFGSFEDRWAAAGSLLVTLGYGALAGFGLPVQRALVMALVAFSGKLFLRRVTATTLFSIALVAVILLNPMATLAVGFWLSFGAVLALLYCFTGRSRTHAPVVWAWLAAGMRTQWSVTIGMLPVLLSLLGQVSLVSFAVNLLAIPWIGFAVVPILLAALLGFAVYEPLGAMLARLADFSLAGLWQVLVTVAAGRWIVYTAPVPQHLLLAGLAGAAVVLAPRGFVPRWPGVVLLASLFHGAARPLENGELVMRVLDVGQGLAVTLRSRRQTWVYDTGPRSGDRFDAGEQVVTPMLRRDGAGFYLDTLVVSHGDLDHAGGKRALLENFHVARVLVQSAQDPGEASCDRDLAFDDGVVRFQVIGHDLQGTRSGRSGNDRSCVVRVESGEFSLLLPGDIESEGERYLLARGVDGADVVLAPHHGSASSSGPAFVNRLQPAVAVFSTGFDNRFGHPHASVQSRYRRRGTTLYNTAIDGALTIHYHPAFGLTISAARSDLRRFWYD